jgi:3-hydroxybutyryl-CoA dehydrogenase
MVEAVGVVGGGLMGSGIAEVAARNGCQVVVCEIDESTCRAAERRIISSLDKAAKAGKLTADDRAATLDRIQFTTDYGAFADRDIVIEAVIEDEHEKTSVFRALSKSIVSSECILASNTSSIPIIRLAAATDRPERVLGLHFFNPVPVLPLVEVIPSLVTSPETLDRAKQFAADTLGKQIIVAKDRAGFIVNALLIPYLLSAIRMVESGFATAEDIDLGMVAGCAHPLGPLALTDLIGLDTTAAVARSLYEEFKEPLYAPPPLLLRMVDAGQLGRKTGRGFYDYSTQGGGAAKTA